MNSQSQLSTFGRMGFNYDRDLKYTISSSKIIAWFFILWCGGWTVFIPLTLRSIIGLFIIFLGFTYCFISLKNKLTYFDFIFLSLSIGVPVISSIQASVVFGQPIGTGIISLRNFFNLLILYYFLRRFKNINLNKYICSYQLFIMLFDTVLLYVFNIDSNRLLNLLPQDENAAFIQSETMENELRGLRLTFGSGLTYIAMCIWTAQYYTHKRKSDLWKILVVLLYVAFVTKTRVQLLACIIILLLPLLREMTLKNIFRLIVLGGGIGIIFVFLPGLSSRFLVISDLLGNTQTQGTGDFSGVARLNEILVAWPYILDYPLFGVGNISYHYNGGFKGVLGEYFFLADIGVVGMLLMGGINFCVLYFATIWWTKRRSERCKSSISHKLTVKLILFTYLLLPFMGIFPILDNAVTVALIISIANSNKNYENNISC